MRGLKRWQYVTRWLIIGVYQDMQLHAYAYSCCRHIAASSDRDSEISGVLLFPKCQDFSGDNSGNFGNLNCNKFNAEYQRSLEDFC